jgi:hypothetical protein
MGSEILESLTPKLNDRNYKLVMDNNPHEQLAAIFCEGTMNAAKVIMDCNPDQGLGIKYLTEKLEAQAAAIKAGDMELVERMLLQQAMTLQSVFLSMAEKMISNNYLAPKQIYGNLAFKAQAQCRQSLQALIELKQPRRNTVINNKAHNQQVNYHEAGLAELEAYEAATMTNELLSEAPHATMDRSRTSAASRPDSALAALA